MAEYEDSMFTPELKALATVTLDHLRSRGWRCATAESCTGGLVAALLTAIPGSSDVVDRGFVTYSNESKQDMLDVSPSILARHGAVSAECAKAMAEGALSHSQAQIAVSITGVAGPGGGSVEKPVGLVYFGFARAGHSEAVEMRFGPQERDVIRELSVRKALALLTS